jgi:translation elongation factor EF-Ts
MLDQTLKTIEIANINDLVINEITFSDRLAGLIAKIGENIILRDCVKMQANGDKISYYLHNKVNENFNNIAKIGVLLKTNEINDQTAKNLCMHIVSFKPLVSKISELTPELEKLMPEDKKTKDLVLESQSYLMDSSHTVGAFCKANNIDIIEFKVFSIK